MRWKYTPDKLTTAFFKVASAPAEVAAKCCIFLYVSMCLNSWVARVKIPLILFENFQIKDQILNLKKIKLVM